MRTPEEINVVRTDHRTRDRLLALLKNAEPLRAMNTTALMDSADQMLAMAKRIGWQLEILDDSEVSLR